MIVFNFFTSQNGIGAIGAARDGAKFRDCLDRGKNYSLKEQLRGKLRKRVLFNRPVWGAN